MTPSVSSTNSNPTNSSQEQSAVAASTTTDENMFLQLLVAQLQNQDPLDPSDPTQFVTQLAQFTQVQQTISMSSDVSAIRADLDQLVAQSQTTTPSQ